MNKKLDKVLSEEVKRFNSIMAYQEKLGEGHHYKFYENYISLHTLIDFDKFHVIYSYEIPYLVHYHRYYFDKILFHYYYFQN